MKKVICNFNLFDMDQTMFIYIEENGDKRVNPIGRCKFENLGHMLVELCYANDIRNIHLFGQEQYVNIILQDIDLHSGSAYSNGMIQVEVN